PRSRQRLAHHLTWWRGCNVRSSPPADPLPAAELLEVGGGEARRVAVPLPDEDLSGGGKPLEHAEQILVRSPKQRPQPGQIRQHVGPQGDLRLPVRPCELRAGYRTSHLSPPLLSAGSAQTPWSSPRRRRCRWPAAPAWWSG